MSELFFDYSSGEMGFSMSDNMGMSSNGDMLMRMSDNMVLNMSTGNIDMISEWTEDQSCSNLCGDDED